MKIHRWLILTIMVAAHADGGAVHRGVHFNKEEKINKRVQMIPDYFQCLCDNGQAMDKTQICDGTPDCQDGSDEVRCMEHADPGQCANLRVNSMHPPVERTLEQGDNKNLKHDTEDQLIDKLVRLLAKRSCQADEFQCGDGQCINIMHKCDGKHHCQDATDEVNCLQPAGYGERERCGSSDDACPLGSIGLDSKCQCSCAHAQSEMERKCCGVPSVPVKQHDAQKRHQRQHSPPTARVIEGIDSDAMSIPWQVQLRLSNSLICGGSVLGTRWILTAAHCVHNRHPTALTVIAGRYQKDEYNMVGEQHRVVKTIIVHPDFVQGYVNQNVGFFPNNIALLELEQPLILSKHVRPICLSCALEDDPVVNWNKRCVMSGWAKISGYTGPNTILQQVDAQVRAYADSCDAVATNLQICVGAVGSFRGVCNMVNITEVMEIKGDSGGPLFCEHSTLPGTWVLHGANGLVNCDKAPHTSVSVFTRVSSYCDWIYATISIPKGSIIP